MQIIIRQQHERNEYMDALKERMAERNLRYYAQDLVREIGYKHAGELSESVKRAIHVCRTMNIPVKENFKVIYRSTSEGLVIDWKLSSLGYSLVSLNSDPSYRPVAKMQMELLKKII